MLFCHMLLDKNQISRTRKCNDHSDHISSKGNIHLAWKLLSKYLDAGTSHTQLPESLVEKNTVLLLGHPVSFFYVVNL